MNQIYTDRRPSHVCAFTLVEMLTVMTVIGVLLAVCLPSFVGLNSTGVRRSAVEKTMGVLDQARSLAITEGRNAYVVFSSPKQDATSADPDSSRWGRACAIFLEDTNFKVTQRTPWIYLPAGASYKVNGGTTQTSVLNRPAVSYIVGQPSFPVSSPTGVQTVQLPCIQFDNTGTTDLQNNPQYSRLLIFPGIVNTAGSEVVTRGTISGNDGKYLLDEVRINAVTGRAKYTVDVNDNLATPTPTPTP